MGEFHNNSIFWVEVDKVSSNPFQPRKDFNEEKLNELADSIRQYGVLQPLVVTRKEIQLEDGGIRSEYEILAGERRLRASKIAGLSLIPVIIRSGDDDDKTKLEIAIIENLQREDLNPIDRALAFQRLSNEFKFKHEDIAKKVGKSRVYVTNTIRLLNLPEWIMQEVINGKVTEGHARSILMLNGKPEEQETLFKEIVYKKINAREAEKIARDIAVDRRRKKNHNEDPQILEYEGKLSDNLGTRVQIEKRKIGGKIVIDYFSKEDLEQIIESLQASKSKKSLLDKFISKKEVLEKEEKNKEAQNERVDLYESSHLSDTEEEKEEDIPHESTGDDLNEREEFLGEADDFDASVSSSEANESEEDAPQANTEEEDYEPERKKYFLTHHENEDLPEEKNVEVEINDEDSSLNEVNKDLNDDMETLLNEEKEEGEKDDDLYSVRNFYI